MAKTSKTSSKAGDVPTNTPVERLFAVINLAAKMGMISIADIVYLLDLPRPTAHRLVSTLQDLHYLQKLPVKGKYAVAPRLVSLATSVLASTVVYAPMQALLSALAQKTGETCGVAVLVEGEVEYIASVMGQSPLTLQFQAGQKAPLYCTSSGQVLLASLAQEEQALYLASGPWERRTPNTVTDPKALAARLKRVQSQGYAANESEYILGVVGAAVPIEDEEARVVAALTLSAPMGRRSLGDVVAMIPTLRNYADRIRRVLQPRQARS